MTTTQGDQREKLIELISHGGVHGIGVPMIADTLIAEFPEIGQQPSLDPALRERIESDLDALIKISINNPVQERWPEARRLRQSILDSIAPAAQPQVDREELQELVAIHMYPGTNHARVTRRVEKLTDDILAHLNIAPAAQPLPTRSQLYGLQWSIGIEGPGTCRRITEGAADALIAAGYAREDEPPCPECDGSGQEVWDTDPRDGAHEYGHCHSCGGSGKAREDEPEPQVGEINNQHNRGFDLGWRAAYAEVARYATEVVDDWDSEPYALAKAVSEGGGS